MSHARKSRRSTFNPINTKKIGTSTVLTGCKQVVSDLFRAPALRPVMHLVEISPAANAPTIGASSTFAAAHARNKQNEIASVSNTPRVSSFPAPRSTRGITNWPTRDRRY
jgi:hypothetical protein